MLSFRKMNKVLEINEELGYAIVEPGVSWFDLHDAIEAGGHDLVASIVDIGWGGVVSNTLEHGLTYMPYSIDQASHCGFEVVLPDGDLLRTGSGAMDNNPTWPLYKRGLGPTSTELFMQSNYGIVTKMGYWLMPKPEVYMPLWLRSGTTRRCPPSSTRCASSCSTARSTCARSCRTRCAWPRCSPPAPSGTTATGPMPEEVIDKIAKELGLGRWMMRFALYGDEAVVDHNFAKLKARFLQIPSCGHRRPEARRRRVGDAAQPARAGADRRAEPGPVQDGRLVRRRGGRPRRLLAGDPADRPAREGRAEADVRDVRRGRPRLPRRHAADQRAGDHVHQRDPVRHEEPGAGRTRRTRVAKRMVAEAGKRGYGEYRAHLSFMDLAADQFGFNDHAQRRFNETIKDTLDPNGIIAPGKSGIWGTRLRQAGFPQA